MNRFRFSTIDFPESERQSAFQEIYASIAKVEIESVQNQNSVVDMVGRLLPNLGVYEVTTTPHLSRRTRKHIAEEDRNDLSLLIPANGEAVIHPKNSQSVCCQPGEAFLLTSDSIHTAYTAETMSLTVINLPIELIAPRVKGLDIHLMKKVGNLSTPELRLLAGYTKMLQMEEQISSELAMLISIHIQDLLTLLLGAKGDETEIASGRGLRAARLKAIKQDIVAHITDSKLSITQVAIRQGVSPQYIRALFNGEQTTFADYVNELRLQQIYRQLSNPLFTNRSISTLAYDMGFNSLSWFNRAFKQRFGIKPTDVREKFSHSQDKKRDNFNDR